MGAWLLFFLRTGSQAPPRLPREKPKGDSQIRKHITVYNLDNEIVTEFKSGREMAKYFNIDGKVARAAIAKGEFEDFLLIVKEISLTLAAHLTPAQGNWRG